MFILDFILKIDRLWYYNLVEILALIL